MCCPASSAPPPSSLPSEFYIAGVCSSIFSCAMRYRFKVKQYTKPRCSYALDIQNSARPQTRHRAHVLGHETPQHLKASPLNPTQSSTIKYIRTAETFMCRRLRRTHTNLSIACEPHSRRFEVYYRLSQDLKLNICSAIQLQRHFPRPSLPPQSTRALNMFNQVQQVPAYLFYDRWKPSEDGKSDSGHGSCIQPQRSTSNSRRGGCRTLGFHLALLRMDRLLSDTSALTPAFWLSLCSDVCESSILLSPGTLRVSALYDPSNSISGSCERPTSAASTFFHSLDERDATPGFGLAVLTPSILCSLAMPFDLDLSMYHGMPAFMPTPLLHLSFHFIFGTPCECCSALFQ
ncbi:hypothetical protein C8J57DRAFT_1478663 [Mycena rebaudengoi]|nr:hypothetical protein C8J57DRAFT_1478663 [Mycena rebaudengoi]